MGAFDYFRRPYWIRRWGTQKVANGMSSSTGRKDFKAMLDVQPFGKDDLAALPEGQRQTKRLKAWSSVELTAADQITRARGDWLYYHGRWYECQSCVRWDYTVLAHFYSEFCMVGDTEPEANTVPPVPPQKTEVSP